MMTIIFFIFALGVLILAHELGHFLVAKIFKVKVEEFGIGFPPRILKIQKGETVYSLNLFFVGGFVKLGGEEKYSGDPREFLAQPPKIKFSILIAGILMNLILAYLLFSFGYLFGLPEHIKSNKIAKKIENPRVTIIYVFQGSPADQAGLKLGDKILRIKTEKEEVKIEKPEKVVWLAEKYQGEKIEILIQRGEKKFWKSVVPKKEIAPGEGRIGIGLALVGVSYYKFPYNFYYGGVRTIQALSSITNAFYYFFKDLFSFKTKKALQNIVGPIGIYNFWETFQELGIGYLFNFLALISINLALLNLFPFPALDGGRLIFVIGELIFQRKINPRIEALIHQIGMVILFLLLILITFKDLKLMFKI